MKKALFILLLVVTFSCENESKTTKNLEVTDSQPEMEKELIVSFKFKTNKSDNFKLMLNNINVDEFQKKNIQIIEMAEPTESIDEINAKFGPNNISNYFHIEFGNKEVKEVKISSMDLSFGSNSLHMEANELSEYFIFNKFVDFDSINETFKTKKVNGNHYPRISLKRKAINILIKE